MFEKIIAKIEKYDSIVIFGHLNPDGDCYGSQIALRNILRNEYPQKQIFCVGSGYKKFLHIIGTMDIVTDETISKSLAILLDGNDLSRAEDQRIRTALDFAKIDHHIDLHNFTEGPEVIDDKATSTCELIYKFAKENKFEIDLISASALYLGIMTDTGRFQFADDFVTMFSMVSDLCSIGVDPILLNKTNNLQPEVSLDIKSLIYSRVVKTNGLIYVVIRKNEYKKLGVTSAQICANTSLLSYVVNYPIWFIVAETNNGGMQVEIRSSMYNVQSVAAYFGGGGHTYAAGFTIKEFSQEKIEELVNKLSQLVKKGAN